MELLRKQQSSILRVAALLYDEVDGDGPVCERRKFFEHKFIYPVWTFVFVYIVGSLAFCARWVLAYTLEHGPENTNDTNYVISTWLGLSFLGVAVTFLMAEPVMGFVRFPCC